MFYIWLLLCNATGPYDRVVICVKNVLSASALVSISEASLQKKASGLQKIASNVGMGSAIAIYAHFFCRMKLIA